MITNRILRGGKITLRQITLQDCTDSYVEWLNDPDVNQYLETRWNRQDIFTIEDFVKSQRDNGHSILFAIINNSTQYHIGNIKIGPINLHHHHADISYFIGDKNLWGKGIATEAIRLVCQFGFEEIHLHRIEAGVYSDAVGSWKALEKNGFVREAIFRKQVLSKDGYMDVYRYGILETEYYSMNIHGGKINGKDEVLYHMYPATDSRSNSI